MAMVNKGCSYRCYNVRIPPNQDPNQELSYKVAQVIEGTDKTSMEAYNQQSAIRKLFDKYDLNGDGTIDVSELKYMIEEAKQSQKEQGNHSLFQMLDLSDEKIMKVFNSVVQAEQGHINFQEFKKLCEKLNIIESGHIKTQQLMHNLLSQWIGSVEVEDHNIIFSSVWQRLTSKYGTEELVFPRELLLLGGAPGAGKGTCSPFITRVRGYTSKPIVMSDLLNSPTAKRIKALGGLVGDFEVVGLLFEKLLEPDYRNGVIIDGFPRTRVQVEIIKLLYDRMNSLHEKYHMDPIKSKLYPRVTFRSLMLFVEEKESVERQLMRGHQIKAHNERVLESGEGQLLELRETDMSVEAAKRRYKIFKEQTFDSLFALKKFFPYHFINAQGTIAETEKNIENELLYQSSLELDEDTFATVKSLPTAKKVIQNARQELVSRLNDYQHFHKDVFLGVVKAIQEEVIGVIRMHVMAGEAHIVSSNPVFNEPYALQMLVDVLSDRGFSVVVEKIDLQIPLKIDRQQGDQIVFSKQMHYRFIVQFDKPTLMHKE
jgi:adenylate kinase